MAKKRATSNDVARLAGVSQSAVSMILNNYENIQFSPETVQRVRDACVELDYRIPSARRGRKDEARNKFLMAMCPSYSNLHYIGLLEAIGKQVKARGYTLTVFTSGRDPAQESRFVDLALSAEAAGVLLLYKPVNTGVLKRFKGRLPVVAICDKAEVMDMDIIELDSEKLGTIIAEHLLKLGHRKIAYVSTDLSEHFVPRRLRLQGMQKAFSQANVSPFNIVTCTLESENIHAVGMSSYETGYCLGGIAVEKYPDITALVGMNDMVAIGIMDALTVKNYKIPLDYSVCGCDNTLIAQLQTVSMTTVEHFVAHRGREAVDLLIRKVEEGGIDREKRPASAVRVEFVPQLIARGSTGPNRRKKAKESAQPDGSGGMK